jgi:hypothetical protein
MVPLEMILRNIWISPKSFGSKPEWNYVYQLIISLKRLMGFISWLLSSRQSQKNYPVIRAKVRLDKESVGKILIILLQ